MNFDDQIPIGDFLVPYNCGIIPPETGIVSYHFGMYHEKKSKT
jgi:hypothetical protein